MGSAPAGQNRRNSAHKQGHFQVEGQNLVKGGAKIMLGHDEHSSLVVFKK